MKSWIASLALSAGFLLMASSTKPQDWKNKLYYSLTDGNELYDDCQTAQRTTRFNERGDAPFSTSVSTQVVIQSASCWAYVTAVVDSIPADEYHPGSNVRLSQYVDIVSSYLRNNPNKRHLPAYGLARFAITQAFPPMHNQR